jgi:hypothetical protein
MQHSGRVGCVLQYLVEQDGVEAGVTQISQGLIEGGGRRRDAPLTRNGGSHLGERDSGDRDAPPKRVPL